MNHTTSAKFAHMNAVVMDLRQRTTRPRERPRLIPLAMLKLLYEKSLNGETRAFLQQQKRRRPNHGNDSANY
jgi:hypothetical protein